VSPAFEICSKRFESGVKVTVNAESASVLQRHGNHRPEVSKQRMTALENMVLHREKSASCMAFVLSVASALRKCLGTLITEPDCMP
jgi:hypothetical protein